MQLPKYTRREFCVHSCQTLSAASLAAIASAITGCGGSPTSASATLPSAPTINASVSGGTIALTIDAASPLANVGSGALVQTGSGSFLVARTAQDTFTALTAVCTHQACTVSNYQSGTFECPCHGSQYSTSGTVTRGPAPSALRQFATRFANNVLTITV